MNVYREGFRFQRRDSRKFVPRRVGVSRLVLPAADAT